MSATVLKSTTIDDRDANITYAPPRWTVHTNVESIFHLYGNSDTFSDIQGATATVKFYGNTIEYWGNTGPYHGPCIISVDGKQMATVNSHADADGYPVLLYSKNDLTVGDHVLEVKVVDPSYPNVCEVDRFVANITSGTPSNTGSGTTYGAPSVTGGSSNNAGGGGSKKGPPIAAIAGAVGGAALLILLLGLWWCIRSRKKKQTRIMAISKPLLTDEGVPSSPPPQTPNFPQDYTHARNYNHPMSFASSSSPGPASSYNPPTAYITRSPPLSTVESFNPYAYNHPSPGPAPSSMQSDIHTHTHTSVGPASVFSSTNYSTSTGPVSAFSPIPELSQHEYARQSEKATYSGSGSSAAAARASSSTATSGPASDPGLGGGAAGRARRDILSAEVSDLPPPAYED